MLNVHFTVLAILELALIHQCLFEPAQLAFPLFTAPSSISFLRRFAPQIDKSNRRRVDSSYELLNNLNQSSVVKLRNAKSIRNPFVEFYKLPPNDFLHNVLQPVLQSPTIEILNHLNHHLAHRTSSNDLNTRRLDHRTNYNHDYNNHQLINSNHQPTAHQSHLHHQPILIAPSTRHYYYHLPHLTHLLHTPHQLNNKNNNNNRYSTHYSHRSIVNQTPFSLLSKVQQLKHKLKQQKTKLDYNLSKLKSLKNTKQQPAQSTISSSGTFEQIGLTTLATVPSSSLRTGYLQIGSTAHQNQFSLDSEGDDYVENSSNDLEQISNDLVNYNHNYEHLAKTELQTTDNNVKTTKIDVLTNQTGNSNNADLLTQSKVTSLFKNDLEHLLKQIKPNFVNFNHHQTATADQLDLKSKYAYDLIGTNTSTNFNNQDINQNVEVNFKERTAPDISAGLFSRALGSLTNYLPSAMKTRTSGCVGGTRCQFFLSCWIGSGSLGSSCGPLSTCCITPSKQDIQPAFYGPVINDPHCGRSATRISRIVGGADASFGQFPWQAFVQVGGSRCGGALVGNKHVVTAGHCVARSQHNPSEIRVTLGDYILNSDIEALPNELFSVAEVKLHPNFRFTPQADRYDIAILVLDRVVNYRNNIKPICLPQKDANYLGRVAYVAGWGALQAGSKLRPKVLQHVNVPVIDNNVCEIWHKKRGINIRIHDEMICAGYQAGNKDACQGDSGGPLMLNEFGVWYLIGIVSAGYSCAKQYQPGIYHRVSSSSDWVSASIYQNAN